MHWKESIIVLIHKKGNKVKVKSCPCALTEHHAMKAHWGNGGIAPFIL
jgi:hypothetical protein